MGLRKDGEGNYAVVDTLPTAGLAAACRTLALRPLVGEQTRTASRSLSMRRRLQQIAEDARIEEDEQWFSAEEDELEPSSDDDDKTIIGESFFPRGGRFADLDWIVEDSDMTENEGMTSGWSSDDEGGFTTTWGASKNNLDDIGELDEDTDWELANGISTNLKIFRFYVGGTCKSHETEEANAQITRDMEDNWKIYTADELASESYAPSSERPRHSRLIEESGGNTSIDFNNIYTTPWLEAEEFPLELQTQTASISQRMNLTTEERVEMELLDCEAGVATALSANRRKRNVERLVAGLENPLNTTFQNDAWMRVPKMVRMRREPRMTSVGSFAQSMGLYFLTDDAIWLI